MKSWMHCALVGAGLLGAGGFALAEPMNQTVTYRGTLDRNGGPFTGDARMQFRLCEAPAGDNCGWISPLRDVSVAGGRFEVELGAGDAAFEAQVKQDLQLYVEVAVGPADAADAAALTTLAQRQKLTPQGQAIWSLRAATAARADTAAQADTATRADNATRAETAALADTATRAETADVANRGPLGQNLGRLVPVHIGCYGVNAPIGRGNIGVGYAGVGSYQFGFPVEEGRHVVMATSTVPGIMTAVIRGDGNTFRLRWNRTSDGEPTNDGGSCWVVYDTL